MMKSLGKIFFITQRMPWKVFDAHFSTSFPRFGTIFIFYIWKIVKISFH